MPSDNVLLGAPIGSGSTIRTLSDAGGDEWPASVTCFATTVSAGANVLQVVTPSAGLPVSQQGTWTVTGAGGTFPVTGNATVAQGTAANLLCTASQGGTWTNTVTQASAASLNATVIGTGTFATQSVVTQGTAASLNATVVGTGTFAVQAAQSGTFTVQPGNTANTTAWLVTGTGGTFPATQATAANLNATVVGTGTFVTQSVVTQGTAGNLNCTASQGGTWNVGTVTTLSTITNPVTVAQGTAGNLLCTASQGGTWNVGTVTTVSTVSALTSITNALPAGTNLLGSIAASQQIANVYNGTTAITPQYAAITATASGATTIVSLTAGKSIYILRWSLTANGATNMNWQSHTTTANATGLHYMTQFATAGGSYCPAGIFKTTSGEALDINLTAAVAVGGELTYVVF